MEEEEKTELGKSWGLHAIWCRMMVVEVEAEGIRQRWSEYIGELFHDEREELEDLTDSWEKCV